jgi:hypothetical protein
MQEIWARFDKARSPSVAEWNAAILSLDVELILDGDIELSTHSGFWPAKLDGHLTGFETYFEEWAQQGPLLESGTGDSLLCLRFGFDHEIAAAYFAIAAFSSLTDAIVCNEFNEGTLDVEALKETAKQCYQEIKRPFYYPE